MVTIARIHGRRGRIYMDLTGAGSAEPLPFFASWSISFQTDKAEVTAMGDNNKVYVAGLPDASGDFSGFYDDATVQTYTSAVDGVARKFYLYPSTVANTQYFWGTILPDFAVNGAVGGAVEVKASWNAASQILKQG
jgi:hypothetical protein